MALGKVGGNQLETTLNIDSGTLYVDGTNNRVGVGTASPSSPLTVNGTVSNPQFEVTRSEQTNQGFSIKAGAGETIFDSFEGTNIVYGDYVFNSTKGSTTREHMRVNSDGYVTMPYQPAFTALFAGNNNGTSTLAAGGGDIPFNNTLFDIGSHFSVSTSRFTAPIAGVYQFSASAFLYNLGQLPSGTAGTLELRVNGTKRHVLAYAYFASTTSYPQMSGTALVSLSASDYVTLYTNYGVYTDSSNTYLHFSGCLVS